ncbi:VENN motif pre-toxin domain-containing protein [Jinshanibacter sp. LJY008]|uniref:VENN motif pre-toxin domain-containing protein n=1 Tax=Limnobaculum eriocheiris TaxID=2897391 RepID=A0A9X1MZU2_9GAMM|nr:VENN motif pre-toxin domain-containing protein [Limnobaculum eriocheiris]MCD1126732.1 VENN motif pre-toxin domain-containing protein [Limnobaculum eriocheiris]
METYGTGSNVGRAIQAAGAALTVAMGGGSAGNAAAAASAPFLALEVKKLTEGPDTKDKVINAIAHAIVGGVVAQASGNSAASGAIGAASGELIAHIIIKDLYDGKKPEQLTEAERQTVITLSMIAAGAVGGVVGDSTESTATAAGAGYNAAANNATAIIKEVIKFGGKACVSNAVCRTELVKVSAELLIKAGVTAEVANQISNNMSEGQIDALSSLLTGDAVGATKYLSQIAAEYVMDVDGNKGWTTILPIPEQDPNGGKLVNPITDQQGGTALVNPDQSGQWGASNTGNQEGVPDVGGNTTVTPIADGPSKDDLAYLSDNFQSGSGRGSAIPVPEPVEAINGLIYQSNGKHTPVSIPNNRPIHFLRS